MTKKVWVFLFNGYSDWEISYVMPELNKSDKFELVTFSKDGKPVTSMGGLSVQPGTSLAQFDTTETDLLILPGGTAWEKGENRELDLLVKAHFGEGKYIAAICGATIYLGQIGILDHVKHTSNDLSYLKAVAPEYRGDAHYVNDRAVSDQNLITANGTAPVEFAREIFARLGLYNPAENEKWFQLFRNGIWSE
jgi:putative intracellular protease/amidase